MQNEYINIKGARVNNLKNINVKLPKNKFVVITGLSGSGKSSLAFDTIYAEGQRRYMESLSSYARQFLETQDKPDVDEITGLSPTIAIDQRSISSNPRSTVGTITEIYDYLRLLFARIGTPHCPNDGQSLGQLEIIDIAHKIKKIAQKENVKLLVPLYHKDRKDHKRTVREMMRNGVKEIRFNEKFYPIEDFIKEEAPQGTIHNLEAVILELNKNVKYQDEEFLKMIRMYLDWGNGIISIYNPEKNENILLSENLSCPKCHFTIKELEPRSFSFNNPYGACPACTGLGIRQVVDVDLAIPNKKLTLAQGAIKPWTRISGNSAYYSKLIAAVAEKHNFSVNAPISELSKKAIDIVMEGTGEQEYEVNGKKVLFEGVAKNLEQRYKESGSDYMRKEIEGYMRKMTCPTCLAKRLNAVALLVTIDKYNIADLVNLSLEKTVAVFKKITSDLNENQKKISNLAIKEIIIRLQNLIDVGLGYLMLDRSITTLSGGEAQRVRLSTQISSDLSGVIYILDEPTVGLHERDTSKLLTTLKKLRDNGNTVITVEHDITTIKSADWVIDIGPGAGEYGGKIIAEGTVAEIKKDKNSITAGCLNGTKKIKAPEKRRVGNKKTLNIIDASGNNLKNITAKFPLGKLICVTGVSGSGKSTLVIDTLAKALSAHFYRSKDLPATHKSIKGIENIDKVISIDQSPIGKTPRSNPATYTGVFTAIRDLFTEVPEARMKGYDAGKFSFNVKGGGRCETCGGEGYMKIEMQFLPDVFIECKDCNGKRYNKEALEIHYKGKTIADVLEMSVQEAREFFIDQQLIYDKLSVLYDVGLGYLRLGQPANKLSGGEAQRVKLATELSRRETGRTFYILDEPTTGLHFEDIRRLLDVLNLLVDKGNTVVIIEHNVDVIRSADWVIDIGPDGGDKGGEIIAEGTPEEIKQSKKSITGHYL
ncbi:excinuclease ABC subunit UvrA [Candidatus Parcubacteria bacterium]|nr:excinuclease ABC subunit UvrA [Candidatus Parcubacteria bacterium]